MDVTVFLPFALELADTAHAILSKAGGVRPTAEVKPDRSFVTSLDSDIERVLRRLIVDKYPEHGILGEELGSINLDHDLVWVLDPIDGTAPFIAGIPVYGTLISLCYKSKPVIGIIDMASTQDRWVGVKGFDTKHTSGICHTRKIKSLDQAILTTSNPDFYATHELPALEALKQVTSWRIYGGCCMAYGLLASGRTDIAIDTRFQIYDYAPFVPIIEGAGGVITDWEGQELTLHSGNRVLAAGNPALHTQALALVKAAMA